MRTVLPIDDRVERAAQLVLRSGIFFDIWFYFEMALFGRDAPAERCLFPGAKRTSFRIALRSNDPSGPCLAWHDLVGDLTYRCGLRDLNADSRRDLFRHNAVFY